MVLPVNPRCGRGAAELGSIRRKLLPLQPFASRGPASDVVELGLAARELAHCGVDARDPLGGAGAVALREAIVEPFLSELASLGVFGFSDLSVY